MVHLQDRYVSRRQQGSVADHCRVVKQFGEGEMRVGRGHMPGQGVCVSGAASQKRDRESLGANKAALATERLIIGSNMGR